MNDYWTSLLDQNLNYMCRFHGCGREFDTPLGRSVHERTVHGSVINSRKTEHKCPYCKRVTYFDSELTLQIHLDEYHGIRSETLEWFEKRSFENLVHLYDDELHKIQSQNIIDGLLDERELSKLRREGVLIIEEHGRMGKPTIYNLSEEALQILKDVTDNN